MYYAIKARNLNYNEQITERTNTSFFYSGSKCMSTMPSNFANIEKVEATVFISPGDSKEPTTVEAASDLVVAHGHLGPWSRRGRAPAREKQSLLEPRRVAAPEFLSTDQPRLAQTHTPDPLECAVHGSFTRALGRRVAEADTAGGEGRWRGRARSSRGTPGRHARAEMSGGRESSCCCTRRSGGTPGREIHVGKLRGGSSAGPCGMEQRSGKKKQRGFVTTGGRYPP